MNTHSEIIVRVILVAAALVLPAALPNPVTAQTASNQTLHIDSPVQLKDSKVVFNMDHLAFNGDQSTGLTYMQLMHKNYEAVGTKLELIAVFHGAIGYLLLDDAAYNKARKTDRGNPYKAQILSLQNKGIQLEECGQTAKNNGWINADFIPGIKINSGANLRLVQLQQDGFIQIQP